MSNHLALYRLLERRLWVARWRREGEESAEEDAILDEMDGVWWKLSEDERSSLSREGPRCWPMDGTLMPLSIFDAPLSALTAWAYEGFQTPEETILSREAA